MNMVEPAADMVMAGAVARAVEPSTGVDADGHTTERNCLNCGADLLGDYCHVCGQRGHVHRTLHAFFHDLLHGVLHFEGKIFRTLPKLMFKPGELTRRYIAGERARFVSPLALFLFSVFTMFAVMSLLGSPLDMFDDSSRVQLQREQGEIETRIEQLRQERTALAARGGNTAGLDKEIREAETAAGILRDIGGATSAAKAPSATEGVGSDGKPYVQLGQIKVVGDQQDASSGSSDSPWNRAYKAAKQNPKLLIYKLQTNAYKFSWALIIISVPFMALLFLWRWRPLYDHAVFVTYSITAVSILVITGSVLILAGVPSEPLVLAIMLFIPWHMYRQLRGGYGLRRLSALWRTLALLFFANFALGLFALGLLMLGVLG